MVIRAGNLMPQIAEAENLYLAVVKAARGKRHQEIVQRFLAGVHDEVRRLGSELLNGTVRVGEYRRFVIHDPKRRIIHAAPFCERVLHHAIFNVCEPVFERALISDTFACRLGKGKHAAWRRAQDFCARFAVYAKLDVRRYFDSIDHELIEQRLERLLKDKALLDLLRRMVASYQTAPGRGLPIGTLVSQHCANLYLGVLDRFVKEELRVKGYLRYMDDSVLWAKDPVTVRRWSDEIAGMLGERLHLSLKPPIRYGRTADGVPLLGGRVFAGTVLPDRRTRRRVKARVRELEMAFSEGRISESELERRIGSVFAAIAATKCLRWRRRVVGATNRVW